VTLAILGPIENVLTEVLIWFHETVGLSWAWSIVAVTVAVRILLVPVAIRQIHSMQSLQIHAPEMKAIQQRYKNDRQKQSEELMKFYRENKINPYASCLPIVLQIPIFIGLFFVLRDFQDEVFCSPGLGGDTKCEVVDGDQRVLEPYVGELEWLDLVNITANTVDAWGPLLLVVYVISQLTSTWLMSTAMQSAAQRWLIMALPIVFIPFILGFPSGLMIYWLTTNLWSTGQGIVTRRLMPRPVPPPKRTSRTPPREATAAVADGAAAEGDAAASAPARSGPPRRVKRKKGGGGRRR
jgi:YidC/Oxa1 family membrane protein insertase